MSCPELRRSTCFVLLTTAISLWVVAAHRGMTDDSVDPNRLKRLSGSRPPNIVFILADDLGYRELGCFGQEKIRTPHLDRLASEGMRLTQHYCGNAVCAPSRCVLMTGKHPGRAWIRDNRDPRNSGAGPSGDGFPPEGQMPIPDEEVTLAELLKQRGYVTGLFGKWGLGGPGSTGEPLRQGFDRFFGYNCQRHAHSHYPDYLWSDNQRIPLMNQPPVPGHAKLAPGADPLDPFSYRPFKGQDYAPDRIREAALQFIRDHQQDSFFLYYPTTLPHVALHVPDQELEPYLAENWADPPFTAEKGGYTPHFTPRAAYAAMVSHMDSDAGALLDELRRLNLDQQTIVIFSSDNGTTHLNQEVDADFFGSVGELRGLKGSLYEGGIRVPTIVRWPGKIPADTSSDFVSGFEDWLPTLVTIAESGSSADISGAAETTSGQSVADSASVVIPRRTSDDAIDGIDGINLLPTLLGERQTERPFLYREFPGYGGQQAIRQGKWKAVRQRLNAGVVRTELYDLEADPGERQDIASGHPAIVSSLEQSMISARQASKLFPLRPFDSENQ